VSWTHSWVIQSLSAPLVDIHHSAERDTVRVRQFHKMRAGIRSMGQ
jgi:hypothetical protein